VRVRQMGPRNIREVKELKTAARPGKKRPGYETGPLKGAKPSQMAATSQVYFSEESRD